MEAPRPLVLLAEDDVDLRRLITIHLTRGGMQVAEVCDGVELYAYLTDASRPCPDVVVSDVEMPNETGPEALARVNKVGPPVVLMTAAPERIGSELAGKMGVVAIVSKPFEIKALVRTIRAAVLSKG